MQWILGACGSYSRARISSSQRYEADLSSLIRRVCLANPTLLSVGTTYLDHAGTTLYAKSLIDSFSRDLTENLYGNPHSMSASSQTSTRRIDDIRLRALRFFNANPDDFDIVFVANATAAIKLVADALRDMNSAGFWYGYHIDAHTSLVGVRELAAAGSRCFLTDQEVEAWMSSGLKQGNLIDDEDSEKRGRTPKLFAYPAQSNMNGRRLPLQWCGKIRQHTSQNDDDEALTLLDAASLVSTSPLDLGDAESAPDFTAISFYKIFGFPDLGALIVRKSAAHIFDRRRYFGGGTVGMVTTLGMEWHARKETSIHDRLEDGTLPFHSIIALDSAFTVHSRLYGSMTNISLHTHFLAKNLYERLSSMRHASNGAPVCEIYKHASSDYAHPSSQGPIVSFNLRNSRGEWAGKSEVEKLAAVKNVEIRSGTLCNPGGAASSLGWTGAEQRHHYSYGLRCGDEHDIVEGRPTGILRVSLGAMSSMADIDAFVAFIDEFYIEKARQRSTVALLRPPISSSGVIQQRREQQQQQHKNPRFYIESLCVYPIKSCAAFKVPEGKSWEIKKEGLAWDREWCLVHEGTGAALSQKRYPLMALIRPFIDLERGILRITRANAPGTSCKPESLDISLSRDDQDVLTPTSMCDNSKNSKSSVVCGDQVTVHAYTSPAVSDFFSKFLGVPCTLARFPPQMSTRLSHPRRAQRRANQPLISGNFPEGPPDTGGQPRQSASPILLSNESPILVISRSSVNFLNETIKTNPTSKQGSNTGGITSKAVAADVFRANIIIAENLTQHGDLELPYTEDGWTSLTVGSQQLRFDILGSCQRCQMVCIDQYSGIRSDEPFSILAKTRRIDGKILFGRHATLASDQDEMIPSLSCSVKVGDAIVPSYG